MACMCTVVSEFVQLLYRHSVYPWRCQTSWSRHTLRRSGGSLSRRQMGRCVYWILLWQRCHRQSSVLTAWAFKS